MGIEKKIILCIDVGNTVIRFGLYGEGALRRAWSIPTGKSDQSRIREAAQENETREQSFHAAMVASVVPAVDERIRLFVTDCCGNPPVFLHSGLPLDITIHYRRPEQVGADRLANVLAVRGTYALPAVVVDFGTAVTFDLISAEGAYLGGVIAAGNRLVRDALAEETALLPRIRLDKPSTVLGQDTEQAIQAGLYWGQIGMIREILKAIRSEVFPGHPPTVVATGGDADLWSGVLPEIETVETDLTLRGLYNAYVKLRDAKQQSP